MEHIIFIAVGILYVLCGISLVIGADFLSRFVKLNGVKFISLLLQLSILLSDLGMENSFVSLGESKVPGGWSWNPGDAYLPAGAVVSDIQDMARYASVQLDDLPPFQECHKKQLQVDASPKQWQAMDIHADAMGLAWILDEKNGFIWHNGGTSNYNSYLGFCPKTETAVVVLSNLKPNYRISATVIGIKLLKELQ